MNTIPKKFRVWADGEMSEPVLLEDIHNWNIRPQDFWMQFTGLVDKGGLTEVYEGDILNATGSVIGNQYEQTTLLKERTHLLVPELGSKAWMPAYKEAVGRGCEHS